MSNSWSHLTENLTSTTPGYLGEVYSGNIYQVKSDPLYGPNRGPPPEMIEKALSPDASIKAREARDGSCWAGLKRTSPCVRITTVLVAIFFISGFIIIGLIGGHVIHVPRPDIAAQIEKDFKYPHRPWKTSHSQTDTETTTEEIMPTAASIVERQVIQTTDPERQVIQTAHPIPSGFVTIFRPVPAEPTQLQ